MSPPGCPLRTTRELIAAQLPLVLLFLATSDWTRPMRLLLALTVQALALVAALGSLAWAGY